MDKGGRCGRCVLEGSSERAGEERRMASTTPTVEPVVGIDISARWFDAARGAELRRFPNTDAGISACLRWLYGRWLAEQARGAGLPVLAPRPWATLADRIAAAATAGDTGTGNR